MDHELIWEKKNHNLWKDAYLCEKDNIEKIMKIMYRIRTLVINMMNGIITIKITKIYKDSHRH